MFYENIIEMLTDMQKVKGSCYGTERCRRLLDALGSPDDGLKIVHVAASNGKGSICEYISCILRADGGKTGTFTSPAVFDYSEQFKIDGKNADINKLKRALNIAYSAACALDGMPSAFEIETAAALYLFYSEGCEYAVLECGLGGLNDATNAINKKEAAVIGSVSLEHTAVLGGTIREICAQKAGIIKNCPAVITCLQSAEGMEYFGDITPSFSGEGLQVFSSDENGQTFSYDGETYSIRMHGREQCYNAALAVDCCRILRVQPYAIREGLAVAKLCGRVEVITKNNKIYVLDGAHNPSAFSPLVQYLNAQNDDKTIIYGCLSDKDAQSSAQILSGCARNFIAVVPQSYRAMDGEKIYGALEEHCGKVGRAESVSAALEQSKTKITAVCGSFTLLAEAKKWIEKGQ